MPENKNYGFEKWFECEIKPKTDPAMLLLTKSIMQQAWEACAAQTANQADGNSEAVAYMFELAGSYNNDTGEYSNWSEPKLSFKKPSVPDASIRNLHALYGKKQYI